MSGWTAARRQPPSPLVGLATEKTTPDRYTLWSGLIRFTAAEDRDVWPVVFTVGVVNYLVGFALAVLLQRRLVLPIPIPGGRADRSSGMSPGGQHASASTDELRHGEERADSLAGESPESPESASDDVSAPALTAQ